MFSESYETVTHTQIVTAFLVERNCDYLEPLQYFNPQWAWESALTFSIIQVRIFLKMAMEKTCC